MRTPRGPTAAARHSARVKRAAAVGPRTDAAYLPTSPLFYVILSLYHSLA